MLAIVVSTRNLKNIQEIIYLISSMIYFSCVATVETFQSLTDSNFKEILWFLFRIVWRLHLKKLLNFNVCVV